VAICAIDGGQYEGGREGEEAEVGQRGERRRERTTHVLHHLRQLRNRLLNLPQVLIPTLNLSERRPRAGRAGLNQGLGEDLGSALVVVPGGADFGVRGVGLDCGGRES
jgi:hypothetical protein